MRIFARANQCSNYPSRRMAWMIGIVTSAILLFCLYCFGDMRYFNNDDARILRPLMGFAGTPPPDFHLYLNALWVYPLRWLGTVFPGIAWFSFLQLALLWIACTVSIKSILCCFAKAGQPFIAGLAAMTVYIGVFAMTYCCIITYTVTAAMLSAAAVLQILSIDREYSNDASTARSLAGAFALVIAAYSLRQITAIPALLFCALALATQGLTDLGKQRSWRAFLLPVALFAGVLIILAGTREWEIQAKEMDSYIKWQRARISVMDYPGIALSDDILKQIGWSHTEMELVDQWYFIDENISTEAFETISAYQKTQSPDSLTNKFLTSLEEIEHFFSTELLAARSIWVLLGVLGLSGASLLFQRNNSLYPLLGLIGSILLTVMMSIYLGSAGRLPLRAVLTVLLPVSAYTFGMLPACLPPPGAARKNLSVFLCLFSCCIFGLSLWYALPAIHEFIPKPENETNEVSLNDQFADLDEYALENPDLLFIYDTSFTSDTRMFPAAHDGTPSNTMFWGGWPARSPEYMAQLAAFGIDGQHTDATIFLHDDVRLARTAIDPPPTMLMRYLQELTGLEVDYMIDGEWGGVHIFQLYAYENE